MINEQISLGITHHPQRDPLQQVIYLLHDTLDELYNAEYGTAAIAAQTKIVKQLLQDVDGIKKRAQDKQPRTADKTIQQIRQWAIDRKLDKQSPQLQMLKTVEETGELAAALVRQSREDVVDAIGDITVTLIVLCEQLGIDYAGAVALTYKVISKRTGRIIGGVYIKDEDIKETQR